MKTNQKATVNSKKTAKLKIKKGDLVRVLTGKNKGLESPVMKIDRVNRRVYLKGIEVVKHVKPSQRDEEGGIQKVPAYIHISNVALMHPKNKKTITKISFATIDNKKTRVTRKDKIKLS